MLFFELTNFSAVFFQKNYPPPHFSTPLQLYTLLIYMKSGAPHYIKIATATTTNKKTSSFLLNLY